MKALVTGATGFIGNYVVEQLIKSDMEVVATSSRAGGRLPPGWPGKVQYVEYDFEEAVEEKKNLFRFFDKPDLLIHLAWKGLPEYRNPIHMEQLEWHTAFIKNLVEHGLPKISVAGTCLEYGMREGCLVETMTSSPILPYSIAKLRLFEFISSMQLQHKFNFVWLRLFYTFGKGQHPQSLFAQLQKAIDSGQKVFNLSRGDQQRDYLPVEKMAEYIVQASSQSHVEGIINCCSGKAVTILNLVREYLNSHLAEIELNTGYYAYPDYEPFSFYGDRHKLNEALLS